MKLIKSISGNMYHNKNAYYGVGYIIAINTYYYRDDKTNFVRKMIYEDNLIMNKYYL